MKLLFQNQIDNNIFYQHFYAWIMAVHHLHWEKRKQIHIGQVNEDNGNHKGFRPKGEYKPTKGNKILNIANHNWRFSLYLFSGHFIEILSRFKYGKMWNIFLNFNHLKWYLQNIDFSLNLFSSFLLFCSLGNQLQQMILFRKRSWEGEARVLKIRDCFQNAKVKGVFMISYLMSTK